MGPLHIVDSNFSMFNETTGEYHFGDRIFRPFQCQVRDTDTPSGKGFSVTCPMGTISGDPDHIHVQAKMKYESVDCSMKRNLDYIYSAGTGSFMPFPGRKVRQFSVAHMQFKGTLTIGEHSYPIHGDSWFGRQWDVKQSPEEAAQMGPKLAALQKIRWNWSWMAINLDNGETMSLWDMNNISAGENYTWVTLQHEDGTQAVLAAENLSAGMSEPFHSRTGQNYPTKFTVRIPDMDAELAVESVIKDQEIISQNPALNKYESASRVTGTYRGKDVKGYCYIELFGMWA